MRPLATALFAAILLAGKPTLASETCTLQRLADLPVVFGQDGVPIIHATADGHDISLRLHTFEAFSALNAPTIDALGLTPLRLSDEGLQFRMKGGQLKHTVRIGELHLGRATLIKPEFFDIDKPTDQVKLSDGIVGIGLLRNLDVELDLANGRMSLFSPDHCKDKVAYWSGAYGELGLIETPLKKPYFNTTLDGQQMVTAVDSTLPQTTMDPDTAKAKFSGSGKGFGELDLDAVALAHPVIRTGIEERSDGPEAFYPPVDLALGLNHLKKLRLYFAFGDNKLYVLPATPAASANK